MKVTRKPKHYRGFYTSARDLAKGDLIYMKKMKKHFVVSEIKHTGTGKKIIGQNGPEFLELLPDMQVIRIEPDYIQLTLF